jgi:tetratricopeptide (TPR) repeat protein
MGSLAHGLCVSYAPKGEFHKIVDTATVVIDLIEKAGMETDFFSMPQAPYAMLCSYCGSSMGHLGAFDKGEVFLEKGLRSASERNNPIELGFIENHYGHFYIIKGDWEPAKEHCEKGINYSEKAGFTVVSAVSWGALGYACAMLGDPETGKRHAEKGLKIHRDSGAEMYLSLAYSRLGEIHRHLGDLQNARSLVEEGLRLSQKNNEKHMEAWSWLLLGKILGKAEPLRIHKAEACFLKGIEISRELRVRAMYSLGYLRSGQLYLDAGEKEKAMENLRRAEGLFREMGMDYWLGKTREVLATL